jgi:hypothetical protein
MAEIAQSEREAIHALQYGLKRESLNMAAQLAYDRLKDEYDAGRLDQPVFEEATAATDQRSSPEVRAQILEMFKRGNRKYALPFEKDRLAVASVMGGNWEEYGQIILQMAILDTLLSIEEKLSAGSDGDRTDS